MACSGRQPSEGKEDLGAVIMDFGLGEGGSKGVGAFFKVVTQAVLLFGAETWVLNPRMERSLSSFQHRVKKHITGRQLRIRGVGSWE